MGWGQFFGAIFLLVVVGLLGYYWFIPYNHVSFLQTHYDTYNFTVNGSKGIQFYDNMRYPDKRISYNIQDCPLSKKNNMEDALSIISNLTVLEFYPVSNNEEISVTCDSKKQMDGELIVAGEGGPSNITKTDNFNVILNGQVLILRDSECSRPNIAIHEIFHALGFDHSKNPGNVMYPVSDCDQQIGDDIPSLIDKLYSYPSYPDLSFENVSAVMNGKYLDANISIRNNGLKDAGSFTLLIYTDDKQVKELQMDQMKIGYGNSISLGNIWVAQLNTNEIRFEIKTDYGELDKKNNEIKLEIKQ